MFDTMTLTKIAAGVFGAWLILLLSKWAGAEIYQPSAHGEPSYVIEVASGGDSEPAEEIDLVELLAEADVASGEKVFRKCSACHKVDGQNGVGPHLDGAFDRDIASLGDFGYSGALTALEGNWTAESLNGFLTSPKGFAPGTTMGFAGLKKVEDRVDVIAYLQSLGG